MSKHIVTRELVTTVVTSREPEYVAKYIGRALMVLFQQQTEEERQSDSTQAHNLVGFTGADARSGSITAKYFIKHGTLQDWQRERWTKLDKNGIPRIAKYWRQLDQAACDKLTRRQHEMRIEAYQN